MKRTSVPRLWLFGLGLGVCLIAQAAEPPTSTEQAPAGSGYYQGVKVAIDPTTGRVRPMTADEVAQLRAAVTPSASSLARKGPANEAEALQTMRVTANGTRVLQVPEDLMSDLVATRRADGSLQIGHAADAQAVSTTQEQADE